VLRSPVSGVDVWVDATPEFCRGFGYEPGDLVWVEGRGVVEFYGVFAAQLVFLDISTRSLFLLASADYRDLKRVSRSLKHTRDVVTSGGEVVEIDIAAQGLFLPTDRVMSPLGEATVLGFAGTVYIQTDEMRMNGYEAAASDVFKLTLLRRIGRRAERTVPVNGEDAAVSLNTEDSVNGLLPGDAVRVGRRYAKVVGFRERDVVVRFADEKKYEVCNRALEIIYRADILAKRISRDAPPVEVGSPLIPETNVLPGDIVENRDIGECEFYGCAQVNTLFVSKASAEVFALSFAMLLYPDYFTVKERHAIEPPAEQ